MSESTLYAAHRLIRESRDDEVRAQVRETFETEYAEQKRKGVADDEAQRIALLVAADLKARCEAQSDWRRW